MLASRWQLRDRELCLRLLATLEWTLHSRGGITYKGSRWGREVKRWCDLSLALLGNMSCIQTAETHQSSSRGNRWWSIHFEWQECTGDLTNRCLNELEQVQRTWVWDRAQSSVGFKGTFAIQARISEEGKNWMFIWVGLLWVTWGFWHVHIPKATLNTHLGKQRPKPPAHR